MQTYDATNQGKLVNLEYGEGKSCNESSIIGVKAYYTAASYTSSLWYPSEISLLKSLSSVSHIQIVHWVSGSPGQV